MKGHFPVIVGGSAPFLASALSFINQKSPKTSILWQ